MERFAGGGTPKVQDICILNIHRLKKTKPDIRAQRRKSAICANIFVLRKIIM